MNLRIIHDERLEDYSEIEEEQLRDCVSSAPGVTAVTDIRRHIKGGYSVSIVRNDDAVEAMIEHITAAGYRLVF